MFEYSGWSRTSPHVAEQRAQSTSRVKKSTTPLYYSLYCLHTTPAHSHGCAGNHAKESLVCPCIKSTSSCQKLAPMNLVFHTRRSTTGSQPWQWNRFFLMATIIRRPFHIKTAWPASWARFSSTEPNGQTPLLSYQTLEQTPQGKGDAEGTKQSYFSL